MPSCRSTPPIDQERHQKVTNHRACATAEATRIKGKTLHREWIEQALLMGKTGKLSAGAGCVDVSVHPHGQSPKAMC